MNNKEPVAWMHISAVGNVYFRKKPQDAVFNPQPVYTARRWQTIPDEEVVERASQEVSAECFARGVLWAEAKLKEKNCG